MGTGLRFRARAVASKVPSPPSTISKSTLDGHFVAGQAALLGLHDGPGFLVDERLDAAFTEPIEQARNNFADFRFLRFGDDANAFNGHGCSYPTVVSGRWLVVQPWPVMQCRSVKPRIVWICMPPLTREPLATACFQTRVQEEFAVSFRPQERAFHRGQLAESELQQFARNLGDGFLMLRRVTHDAAFSHLPFAHFELGFDQNNQVRGGRQQGNERGQDQSDGDE